MSLKDDDWKKVLNQPKNAGLKMGDGTGVGKALRDVDIAIAAFSKAKDGLKAHDVILKLDALGKLIDKIVAKHGKLYKTACDYLKTVKADAAKEIKTWEAKIERFNAYEEARASTETQRILLRSIAGDHAHKIAAAKDMDKLKAAWADLLKEFKGPYDKYKAVSVSGDGDLAGMWEQTYLYKAKTEDFKTVHEESVKRANVLFETIKTLPPPQGYHWAV